MLIEEMGQKLSHQPFEWKSWWWGIKWEAFIDIYPELTETYPLWQREDNHLENIRLCGLPPDELQAEIAQYWEKPFWRRWLLSFFTDIDSKIVIWSYYKRCLSFRIIHKENPALEQRLMVYDPEQRLVTQLINQLKRDHEKLEKRLERHAGNIQWVEKNLSVLLARHEKKRQRFFLKLLSKHLKALPAACDQDSVRRKLEEEYQGLEKMLRNYVENSYQVCMSQPESSLPIQENPHRELVYVEPTEVTQNQEYPYCESDDCTMGSINEWLALKRHSIRELLKEEPCPYDTIQILLKKSLKSLQSHIESQLGGYERSIKDIISKQTNYKEALEKSKFLQHRLTYFFRNSSLLFHPDKSYGDEHLKLIQTNLFKEFQQFAESSLERVSKGLETLKRCIPPWKVKLDKALEEIERDRKQFREWMEQRFAEIEAINAQTRAETAQTRAETAQIKKSQMQMKAQMSVMEAQMNALIKQMGARTFYSEASSDDSSSTYDETRVDARGLLRP